MSLDICGSIFLIVFGLLSLFNKDLMWKWQEFSNSMRGVPSERTSTWDNIGTIAGVAAIIFGLIVLIASISNGG